MVVVVVDRVLAVGLKKRLTTFTDHYRMISLGMTKQQIIDIMGNKFVQSATMDVETLCWSCDTNTSIQRELYSKKEQKKIITVDFSDGKVIAFKMQ